MEQHRQPVRPGSEYGERPAGAEHGRDRPGQDRPVTGDERSPELHAHTDQVLGILKRGEPMGASAIASELTLEATQVSSLLRDLQHDGLVTRTASETWKLTAATERNVEERPSPKEPRPQQ